MRSMLVAVTALIASPAAGQSPGIFSPISDADVAVRRGTTDDVTIRRRFVTVDTEALADVRNVAARPGAELVLNLFDDAVLTATVERVGTTLQGGYSLAGPIDGETWGFAMLVVNGPVIAGTVQTMGGVYEIRTAEPGLHVVTQVDLSKLPPEAEPLRPDR